jgi:hypothetical protein
MCKSLLYFGNFLTINRSDSSLPCTYFILMQISVNKRTMSINSRFLKMPDFRDIVTAIFTHSIRICLLLINEGTSMKFNLSLSFICVHKTPNNSHFLSIINTDCNICIPFSSKITFLQ